LDGTKVVKDPIKVRTLKEVASKHINTAKTIKEGMLKLKE